MSSCGDTELCQGNACKGRVFTKKQVLFTENEVREKQIKKRKWLLWGKRLSLLESWTNKR